MIRFFRSISRLFREYNATLGGWRFDDIKKYIDDRLQVTSTSEVAQRATLDQLLSRSPDAEPPRFCFVTNLPPEDTGISTCSFQSLVECRSAIDIFCPVTDLDWFLFNKSQFDARSAAKVRLLDQKLFMYASTLQHYPAIFIAIGNSRHCFFIHEFLKKLDAVGQINKVILYVHDPCLLHMIQRGTGVSNFHFLSALSKIYDRPLAIGEYEYRPDWELWTYLIEQKIFGIRYFANLGVKGFLFNSQAACDIAREDLKGLDVSIQQAFHPVFADTDHGRPSPAIGRDKTGDLKIGSFGIPAPSKCSLQIAEAVALLRRSGRRVRFVLAGFQASGFYDQHKDVLSHPDTEIFDGPTDKQLNQIMRSVDLAIQLRSSNLGESSGVVPMLLANEVPTIVSRIGAFREYGDAVAFVDPPASPASIADAVLKTAEHPPSRDQMQAYVVNHSPALFQSRLEEIVDVWRAYAARHDL